MESATKVLNMDVAAERSIFLNAIRSVIGGLYRTGGEGPLYFDCSGLVRWALKYTPFFRARPDFQADMNAHTMALTYWKNCQVKKEDTTPGDLFFYGSGPYAIDHVMVLLHKWPLLTSQQFGYGMIGACGGTSKTHTPDQAWSEGSGVKAIIGDYWNSHFQFAVNPWNKL
jgi:cell wall-associated NlpC family hydrolase